MMENQPKKAPTPFNTIHIFGFGTVQVITDDKNVQVPIDEVQASADACLQNVWANKPQGYAGTESYHAVNTFYGMFSDWQPNVKGEEGFRVQYSNLNTALFETLATEVLAKEPAQTQQPA